MVSLEGGREGRVGGGHSAGQGRGGRSNRGHGSTERRPDHRPKPDKSGGPVSPTSPTSTTMTMTMTSWLAAIQASTSCLFGRNNGQYHYQHQHQPNNQVLEIDMSLAYLNILEEILGSQPSYDVPPNRDPPPFPTQGGVSISPPIYGGLDYLSSNLQQPYSRDFSGNTIVATELLSSRHKPPPPSSNPFTCIYQSSDEEDGDYDNECKNDDGYDDEAGDTVNSVTSVNTMSSSPLKAGAPETTTAATTTTTGGLLSTTRQMDTLRLLVRVSVSQSDLYARRARLMASDGLWMDGAVNLESAVYSLNTGLILCDTEISKYLQEQEQIEMQQQLLGMTMSTSTTNEPLSLSSHPSMTLRNQQLEEDADMIDVSVQSVIREKDKCARLAQRQVERLQGVLQPQWEIRDQVRARIGDDKWKNNPSPKFDYAKGRAKHEDELKQLELALEHLETMTVDTTALQESITRLRGKLRSGSGSGKGGGGGGSGGGGRTPKKQSKKRTQYNRRAKAVTDPEQPTSGIRTG